ncbi:MAG: 3'-5' exonuclease [Saprospiraceae bacterium]
MIVFDIETTGLMPGKHQVVSLGAIHYESGQTFYQECRIYKKNLISASALSLNGFTVEQVTDNKKITALVLYDNFVEWAISRSDILAGHNIGSFDVQFLKILHNKYRSKNKWPFSHRYIDLHSVAYAHFRESLSHDEICLKLGIEPEPKPHNALLGALSEHKAFKEIFRIWGK